MLPDSLIQTESGGNFRAQNDAVGHGGAVGHFGRGQFGQARLQDAMRAGVIPADMTPEQFMADPQAQQAVEAWHVADINSFIRDNGLDQYLGREVGGVVMTPEGMLAMAHLGGKGGLRQFLTTGGEYNPADTFGTSLRDYAQTHGAASGGVGSQMSDMGTQRPAQNALAALQPERNAMPAPPRFNALDPAAFQRQMPQNALLGFTAETSPFLRG